MKRRKFLHQSGGATLTVGALSQAAKADDNPKAKLRLGLMGCGGRGGWIAKLFRESGRYQVAAVADYFQDRVDAVGEEHGLAAGQRFTGLKGYERMLDAGDLDAVAIISPPYFHPEQAQAAVAAGVAVYLAKPIAVDVAGCKSVEQSAKDAAAKGLPFLVDFQTRANPFFTEAMKRVHAGAIGDICFGEALYHANRLKIKTEPGSEEARLRNWVFDKALSGDIITEQNIHTLDVMSWAMNADPISASCTGGRKVRVDVGDCWDHFVASFQYPGNVGVTFSSRQFNGHGAKGGIVNRMFGSKGVLETEYGGRVAIRGGKEAYYAGGQTGAIYKDGVVKNIADFADAIDKGDTSNPTVAPSVQSNLVTILARTSAYEGRMVTWDEIVKSNAKIEIDLEGLKA